MGTRLDQQSTDCLFVSSVNKGCRDEEEATGHVSILIYSLPSQPSAISLTLHKHYSASFFLPFPPSKQAQTVAKLHLSTNQDASNEAWALHALCQQPPS